MGSISLGGKKEEAKDGERIIEPCKALGVPFDCEEGVCGSCMIDVLEGEENFTDLTPEEGVFGFVDKKKRLACQCKMKSGDVKIEKA